ALENRVVLDRLLYGPPCLVGASFVEFDNFEGAEPGARILHSGEHRIRLTRRLQEHLNATVAIDSAFAGADEKGTQPEPRPRVGCVRTCGALVQSFGHEGENSLPQGFPKRADREAGRLAEPDDNR